MHFASFDNPQFRWGGAPLHMRLCECKEKESLKIYSFITLSYCIARGGDTQAVNPFTSLKERRSWCMES